MSTTNAETGRAAPPGIAPGMIALLCTAMLLNYADRGSLSTVSPVLRGELGIDDAQMGLLLSAFFWTYAFAQPIAGWVGEKYPPRTVIAVGVGLWSLATMACGLGTGFVSLLVFRLLLGLGESVIFPASARVVAEQARDEQRGTANGISMIGLALGPSLGSLAGTFILVSYGWQWVFVVLGGVSLLWLVPWLRYRRWPPPPPGSSSAGGKPAPYRELLRSRGLLGASLGQFTFQYPAYMLLTWMPIFLVRQLGLTLTEAGIAAAGVFACQATSAILSGVVSDRMIRAGTSTTFARKLFLAGGMAIVTAGLIVAATVDGPAGLVGIVTMAIGIGLTQSIIFTVGQTLAGPRASSRWIGIQNMAGNMAGIVAPIVTGILSQSSGNFDTAFLVAAVFALASMGCWLFVVGPVREIAWGGAEKERTP